MAESGASEEEKEEVRAIVGRILEAFDCRKKELFVYLGCKEGTINNWIHFGRIPYRYIVTCSKKTGRSVDWLLYGKCAIDLAYSKEDVTAIVEIVANGINSAREFELIQFNYPDAGDKLLTKITRDIEAYLKFN